MIQILGSNAPGSVQQIMLNGVSPNIFQHSIIRFENTTMLFSTLRKPRHTYYLLLSIILLTSCATQTVKLSEYPSNDLTATTTTKFYTQLTFDQFGRPLYLKPVATRPTQANALFYLVDEINHQPQRAFQIAIIRHDTASLLPPLNIIFEWTATGMVIGLDLISQVEISGDQPEQFLVIMTIPVIISVGGLVAGVIASIPEFANQLQRIFLTHQEILISYSTYQYDQLSRLVQIKTQSPSADGTAVSVSTRFFYTGEVPTPIKAEVTSFPENKTRIIQPGG